MSKPLEWGWTETAEEIADKVRFYRALDREKQIEHEDGFVGEVCLLGKLFNEQYNEWLQQEEQEGGDTECRSRL